MLREIQPKLTPEIQMFDQNEHLSQQEQCDVARVDRLIRNQGTQNQAANEDGHGV
jgi:hypothetical protein